jgi:hypothetical protein
MSLYRRVRGGSERIRWEEQREIPLAGHIGTMEIGTRRKGCETLFSKRLRGPVFVHDSVIGQEALPRGCAGPEH